MTLCECGCGMGTAISKGVQSRFIRGHNWRLQVKLAIPQSIDGCVCACGCGLPAPIAKQTDVSKGYVAGRPKRYRKGHQKRQLVPKNYRRITGGARLHRLLAERALGRPLPPGVVVHHADGTKRDDAPLVICQDAAYHNLLHKRMRIVRLGGNPQTQRICGICRRLVALSQMGRNGQSTECKPCVTARARVVARLRKGKVMDGTALR